MKNKHKQIIVGTTLGDRYVGEVQGIRLKSRPKEVNLIGVLHSGEETVLATYPDIESASRDFLVCFQQIMSLDEPTVYLTFGIPSTQGKERVASRPHVPYNSEGYEAIPGPQNPGSSDIPTSRSPSITSNEVPHQRKVFKSDSIGTPVTGPAETAWTQGDSVYSGESTTVYDRSSGNTKDEVSSGSTGYSRPSAQEDQESPVNPE